MDEAKIRAIVRSEMESNSSRSRFALNTTGKHAHTGLDSPRVNSGDLIPGLKTSGRVEFDSTKDYRFNVNFNPTSVVFYGNPYHTTGGVITAVAISGGGTGYGLGGVLNISGGINGTATITGVSSGAITSVSLANAGFGYTTGTNATTGGGGTGATVSVTVGGVATVFDRHTFVFGQAALGQNLYFQPDTTSSVTIGGKPGIVQTSTTFLALNNGGSSSFQAVSNQTSLIHVEDTGSAVVDAKVFSYGKNSFTIRVGILASGWVIIGNYFVS
jgi:hypothetical protein